jgi:hypothetical protein
MKRLAVPHDAKQITVTILVALFGLGLAVTLFLLLVRAS